MLSGHSGDASAQDWSAHILALVSPPDISFLPMQTPGKSGDGSRNWVPSAHGGDLAFIPGSWFQASGSGPLCVFWRGSPKHYDDDDDDFEEPHAWVLVSVQSDG